MFTLKGAKLFIVHDVEILYLESDFNKIVASRPRHLKHKIRNPKERFGLKRSL
jgi:hypothetical protein